MLVVGLFFFCLFVLNVGSFRNSPGRTIQELHLVGMHQNSRENFLRSMKIALGDNGNCNLLLDKWNRFRRINRRNKFFNFPDNLHCDKKPGEIGRLLTMIYNVNVEQSQRLLSSVQDFFRATKIGKFRKRAGSMNDAEKEEQVILEENQALPKWFTSNPRYITPRYSAVDLYKMQPTIAKIFEYYQKSPNTNDHSKIIMDAQKFVNIISMFDNYETV